MRFGPILVAYFLIGVVMWGGGVIAWQDAGLAQEFIDPSGGNVSTNDSTARQLEQTGGVIDQAASSLAGPVILIWNLITNFLRFLFWPTSVMIAVNAPPRLTALASVLTVAFFVAIIGLLGRIS